MIIKAVSLFLIGMLVLGMFGKLRMPKPPQFPKKRRGNPVADAKKCKDCGGYIIGDQPCSCKKPDLQ